MTRTPRNNKLAGPITHNSVRCRSSYSSTRAAAESLCRCRRRRRRRCRRRRRRRRRHRCPCCALSLSHSLRWWWPPAGGLAVYSFTVLLYFLSFRRLPRPPQRRDDLPVNAFECIFIRRRSVGEDHHRRFGVDAVLKWSSRIIDQRPASHPSERRRNGNSDRSGRGPEVCVCVVYGKGGHPALRITSSPLPPPHHSAVFDMRS